MNCSEHLVSRVCGCVPFFYPPLHPVERNTCTLNDVPCIYKNRDILTHQRPVAEARGCLCYPLCSDTLYKLHCQRGTTSLDVHSVMDGLNISDHAILHFGWSSRYTTLYRRDVSLSWDGLMASFGGIIGLCLGGSIISAAELIYLSVSWLWTSGLQVQHKIIPLFIPNVNYLFQAEFKHHRVLTRST